MAESRSNRAAVQATNDDASASKLSCVRKGYIKDDYIHLFVRKPLKRAPIINRGYFARWAALHKLLLQFLGCDTDANGKIFPRKQILSLGAGFDTTYFQLQEQGIAPHRYVEVDFKEVTSKKAGLIKNNTLLSDKIGSSSSISQEDGHVMGDNYVLLPVDLRDIEGLDSALASARVEPDLPTFIIAECVLIYLNPDSTQAIVSWAAKRFSTAIFLLYEQVHPNDPFGQQMVRNLEGRGCALLGIYATPTLLAKKKVFLDNGWQMAAAWDMLQIYSDFIENKERQRIEKLELFDEFEEWHMMQEHYCVAYAVNDALGMFKDFGFPKTKVIMDETSTSSP